jgi:hypothetical protein
MSSNNNDKKPKPPFVVADLNVRQYPLPMIPPRLSPTPLTMPTDIKNLISFITGGGLPPLKPIGIEVIRMDRPSTFRPIDLDDEDFDEDDDLDEEGYTDQVKPAHYRSDSGIEAIDVIEAWELDFNLGNVVKYICRDGLKDSDTDYIVNLEKAMWYLQREIANRKAKLK